MAYTATRLWWGLCRSISRRSEVYGVRVWHFMPIGDGARMVSERITHALALIATHDPRQLELLQKLSAGIIVMDQPMLYGSWVRGPRLVRLTDSFLIGDEATPARIAVTIVHELAHARLDTRGFGYAPERRHRIEAICFRAEAAFARKLPDGDLLAEEHEKLAQDALASGPGEWSRGAQLARDSLAMEMVGVPAWIVRAFRRRAERSSD
jgi:hypothetical protein